MPIAGPRQPRRGRAWMVLALILIVLLGLSLLINFSQFAAGFGSGPVGRHRMAGPRLDEVVLEDNGAANKVAVLDINGIISSSSIDGTSFTLVDLIKAQFERAKRRRPRESGDSASRFSGRRSAGFRRDQPDHHRFPE